MREPNFNQNMERKMSRLIYTVIIFVIVILGVVFAVLNAELVHLNFYFGAMQLPLSLALVLATLVGAVLGILASTHLILKNKREVSRMRRSADIAEKEIANLRAIPIKNPH
jgi:putative membrane protein